jgi:hypothetical protein
VKGETLMIKALGAVALTIVLLAGVSATADPEACRGALRILKSARGGVGDYLRRYASCVSQSNGRDDCSREFSGLRSAQDNFELAVSEFDRDCP